jgi:tetratricopeptide (TPR) repeat protein
VTSRRFWPAILVLFALAIASAAPCAAPEDGFADLYAAGLSQAKDGRHAEARASLELALSMDGISPDQSAQALVAIADTYTNQWKWLAVGETLDKAIALEGLSDAVRATAFIKLGKLHETRDWAACRRAYAAALRIPGILPGQMTVAKKGLAKACIQSGEQAAARDVLRDLVTTPSVTTAEEDRSVPPVVLQEYAGGAVVPDQERAALQLALAKTFFAEQRYEEARAELSKALTMPGITRPQQADAQLFIGLCSYEAGDLDRAKPELVKVLRMPDAGTRPPWDGGRMGYVPAREALLRLKFAHAAIDEAGVTAGTQPAEKELKVLFVGSSHTLRGDLPDVVTRLAASAPADRPRVIAGDYIRMGTSMKWFWDAGDGPDTARGVIAAEPWDAVVVETFYNMNGAEIDDYARKFVDLIRRRGARPIIYESPLPKASAYPERFRQFHADNVGLVKSLDVAVAPSVAAWMRLLGPKPSEQDFDRVYADWIHASPRGAYVTGCCLYTALTDSSPIGLYHPAEITDDEARTLQEAAWEATRETNRP